MSTLGEVISQLRAALAELPIDDVTEARNLIADDITPQLATLIQGTTNEQLNVAYARLFALIEDLGRVQDMFDETQNKSEEWISAQSGEIPQTSVTISSGRDHPSSRVTRYRERLERPWPYGRPLRGWRLATTDDREDSEVTSGVKLASGEVDPAYTAAVERARALGLARGGFAPDIARHIEVKEASTMREGETRTIVIGKDPCGIDPVANVSCHRFLRYFLPADATLIVYGPTGTPYRYEGKRTS